MVSLKLRILLAGLVGMAALSACNAEDKSKSGDAKPVVTVNGKAINEAAVTMMIKSQNQPDTPELRQIIREDLITRELMSQEAKKKKLDGDAEVKLQMELASQTVLVRSYLQDYAKSHPITDDAIKAEYEKIKAQMGGKEYNARHILVKTEAEANEIAAKLQKGEKFEALASKSEDPGSKDKGGELGWVAKGQVVKPFGDALETLKKGEISKPVQSQFGWHVIRVDDSRDLQAPPLDGIKNELRQRLEQMEMHKLMEDLRSKAKIVDSSAPKQDAAAAPAAPKK